MRDPDSYYGNRSDDGGDDRDDDLDVGGGKKASEYLLATVPCTTDEFLPRASYPGPAARCSRGAGPV